MIKKKAAKFPIFHEKEIYFYSKKGIDDAKLIAVYMRVSSRHV